MTAFDKWWNDLPKHSKRVRHWLPHWKELAARRGGDRPLKYFTLCARAMIDVFMLVQEGLLEVEPESNAIKRVQFCECEQEQFDEIKEIIAREDAGFFGKLEDVVLFRDDDFTAEFPTLESIEIKLEDESLQNDLAKLDKLLLKRTSLNAKASFPYDCINLDFCDYYYPSPPGMLRINETVERFLDWQRRVDPESSSGPVNDFVLAVTCRYDANFPAQARGRLTELIRANCRASTAYMARMTESRQVTQAEEWAAKDPEDMFFAGWPKDIARAASEFGWSMEVLDYVYYRRTGDSGTPYLIACLVARFSKNHVQPDDTAAAMFALDANNRDLIDQIDRESPDGRELVQNLEAIVALRNEQARRKSRPELPAP
jgi:hypothetical protein